MNRVILIGRLATDPELRFTANGKAVASFRIAVNRIYSKEKEADFINVAVWGKTAENSANYLAKGRLVGLEGRLQTRTNETQTGERRYFTEVIADNVEFLDWGSKGKQTVPTKQDNDFTSVDIDISEFQAMDEDEDIPF